jgi:hypothetical protein
MTTAGKLTAEQRAIAQAFGLTPEQYAAWSTPHPDPKTIEAVEKKREGAAR